MLLQRYTNTLQIVFANVASQSMQPETIDPSQSPSTPQAAPCSCKEAATSNTSTIRTQAVPATQGSASPTSFHQQTQQPSVLLVSQQRSADSAELPDHISNTSATQSADGSDQRLSEPHDACLATANREEGEERGRTTGQIGGYSWQLPVGVTQDECIMLWVGPESVPILTHLHLTFNK